MAFNGSTWPTGSAKPKPKPAPAKPAKPVPFKKPRPGRKPPPGWRPRPKPAAPPPKPAAPGPKFPPRPPSPGRIGKPNLPRPKTPFGKPGRIARPIIRGPYPWRPPGIWPDVIDVLGDLIFQSPDWLPSYNPGTGWTQVSTCARDPLYNEGQVVTVAKGCTSTGCLTAQASPGPGYVTCQPGCVCTGGVPCFRLRVDDVRFLGAPVNAWRAHYRAQYIWNCPAVGNPGPSQPRTPSRPHYREDGAPDPWAEQPPGSPMPRPQHVPYRWVPGIRDPNEWLDPRRDPSPQPRSAPRIAPAPSPMPGGGTVVLPVPPGWIAPGNPAPSPSPGANPAPAPRPGTNPLPVPTPGPGVPNPWPGANPLPGSSVVPAPGYGAIIDPNGNVRPSPRTRTHRREARNRGREKKMRAGPIFSALWQLFGQATEALDALDIAYDSLPCSLKYAQGMMGRRITAYDKAQFVARNVAKMNPNELGRNYLKNQFEDWFYGTIGKQQSKYYQQYFDATGANAGASKFTRYPSKAEQDAARKAGIKTPRNPIIDKFNEYVDRLFGKVPDDFGCCAGKSVSCGRKGKRG